MHEAAARRSHPQAAVPIPEQAASLDLCLTIWQRIRPLQPPIHESLHSPAHRYQQSTLVVLRQIADAIQLLHRVKHGGPRTPLPQPIAAPYPEIAGAVAVDVEHGSTQRSVGTSACHVARLDRAQSSG